jgi:hypothetical protein
MLPLREKPHKDQKTPLSTCHPKRYDLLKARRLQKLQKYLLILSNFLFNCTISVLFEISSFVYASCSYNQDTISYAIQFGLTIRCCYLPSLLVASLNLSYYLVGDNKKSQTSLRLISYKSIKREFYGLF